MFPILSKYIKHDPVMIEYFTENGHALWSWEGPVARNGHQPLRISIITLWVPMDPAREGGGR